MKKLLPCLLLLPLCGCPGHSQAELWGRHEDMEIEVVKGPKTERCDKLKGSDIYTRCQEFRQQGTNYLHNLNTGDTVCMEGGFGEDISDKCKARGVIVDSDKDGFLIQLREPKLESRWKAYDGKKVFFENGALLDLYLKESGFE